MQSADISNGYSLRLRYKYARKFYAKKPPAYRRWRRLPKNPGELVRAAALSNFNRIRRRVRRIRGNFFGGELAPPGEEIASLQFPRPEMRNISAETGGGGSGGGACSPVHLGIAALSNFNRIRRRVRRIRGNFFAGELAPRRRNCFLTVSAPVNPKDFSGNCEGVEAAGELAPPSTSLFYKLSRRHTAVGSSCR